MQILQGGQDHLGNGDFAAQNVKELHVGFNELRRAGIHLGGGGGKELRGEVLQIQVRNGRQNIGGGAVLFRGGGGMEIQGVRQNGAQHQPRQVHGNGNLVLSENGGYNGTGGAHDLVSELNGILGGEIIDPVVVDDLQHLGLFNGPDGLGELVVVHQDQLFAGGLHDVIPGHIAGQVALRVRHRVDVVPGLHHFPAHVLRKLRGGELHQLGFHDLAGGGSEVNVTGGVHGAVAGDDDGAVVGLGGGDDIGTDFFCPDHHQ